MTIQFARLAHPDIECVANIPIPGGTLPNLHVLWVQTRVTKDGYRLSTQVKGL